jgi:hypothetical protein
LSEYKKSTAGKQKMVLKCPLDDFIYYYDKTEGKKAQFSSIIISTAKIFLLANKPQKTYYQDD